MLHSDDHGVVVMRDDPNGVTVRECDDSSRPSMVGFIELYEYCIHNQNIPNTFPSREARTSFINKTSDYGANKEVWIFLGHFKGRW